MRYFFTIFWVCPGPLLPAMLVFALMRSRISVYRGVFLASVVSLVVFGLCVAVPYYFQGYSLLQDPVPGRPIGWTAQPIIGTFAYLYTFEALGFLWLFTGIVQAIIGEASSNRIINAIARLVVILLFAILLLEFHKFNSTINRVLE